MPRSVTEPSESEPNAEMSLIGYVLAAGTALLLIPLAPFLAVLWVFDRLFGGDRVGRTVDRVDYRPN
ncbi:hypothetical protein G9464_09845 [Halostella sp. JP-L12]|uniref:DUF7535 family protein n=1 Tax=Halostella TaxID=1843185 RepID=UPI000EF81A2D|nr:MULTISPECIES: hypothetical protein [Halostella]NHN47898.1 hypothetical protein [Halostella sp. JP-L12]